MRKWDQTHIIRRICIEGKINSIKKGNFIEKRSKKRNEYKIQQNIPNKSKQRYTERNRLYSRDKKNTFIHKSQS